MEINGAGKMRTEKDISDYLKELKEKGSITPDQAADIREEIDARAENAFNKDAGKKDPCYYFIRAFDSLVTEGKIPPRRAVEAPRTRAKEKNEKLPAEAEKGAKNGVFCEPSADYGAEQKERGADFNILRQYIDCGFTLEACKPCRQAQNKSGAAQWKTVYIPCDWRQKINISGRPDFPTASKDAGNADAKYIRSTDELKTAINNGVHNFQFLPSERRYLCIDIDRGHDNGIDGIKAFTDFFKEKNILYDFFNNATVFVDTPSGGVHLYFLDWTDINGYLPQFVNPRTGYINVIEIRGKGNGKKLTAAGSVKNGKPYILHGAIKNAPNLPNMLIKYITAKPAEPRASAETKQSYNNPRAYSLPKLIDFVLDDNAGLGRNDTGYKIGYRVGGQYDINDIVQECYTRPLFSGFPESELRTALKSGIKNSKH